MEEEYQERHFREILRKFPVAMLVSRSFELGISARPMAVAGVDEQCGVWFYTAIASEKVKEIEADNRVVVTCQDSDGAFLALNGRGTLTRDRASIERFWSEGQRVWFPNGKDDPDLALIHVEPERGEYWDNLGANKLKYAAKAAAAYLSGTKPNADQDQHGVVEFTL